MREFPILVIIYGAAKLEPFSITMELGILLLNGLDNMGTKPLTIFLGIKKRGAANKMRQLDLVFFGGR